MYVCISLPHFVCSLLQCFPLFILYYFSCVPQHVTMPGSECGEYQMEGEGELRKRQSSFSLVRASVKYIAVQHCEVVEGIKSDSSVCMNRTWWVYSQW